MTERIGWGVLGGAMIARMCVIPAISNSANGRLHVLGTRTPGRIDPALERAGFERICAGYEAVLADPEVDAVYIPLPNHLHHPWTLKALAAGKHVLCEKPLALNAAQAREMAEAARASGRLLMEAFMYRFHPRSRAIKALADSGALGELRSVRAAFTFAMDAATLAAGDNARLRPDMGGGALLDVGCYGVSLIRWLLAQEPVSVQAQAFYRHGVDVHLAGTMQFESGALGCLEAGFVAALQQTYSAVGMTAAIEVPHNAFIPWEREALYTRREKDAEEGVVHRVPGVDEYRLMVDHFAAAVRGKEPLAWDPEESVRNMEALDALARAARERATVTLPASRDPQRV